MFKRWFSSFWKKSVNLEVLYADKNVLDYNIHFGSSSFFVTCVYGNLNLKDRHKVWERITRIGINRTGSWSMFRDFNDLLHNGEKCGDPARSLESFEAFENMIRGCGMSELPSHGNALLGVVGDTSYIYSLRLTGASETRLGLRCFQ